MNEFSRNLVDFYLSEIRGNALNLLDFQLDFVGQQDSEMTITLSMNFYRIYRFYMFKCISSTENGF